MTSPSALDASIDDRIAAQWIALGGQLDGIADHTAIDLEALVAITADREHVEARVREVAVDWGAAHGRAISVHRLRAVARELGVDEARLSDFAGDVAAAGGPKWPMAAEGEPHPRRGKVVVRSLAAPGRLAWRTRAAFGVNARADILATLLSTPPVPVSISDLTRRTRFTKKLITIAVADMSLAGIVTKTRVGREDRVSLAPESPLRDLLEPDGIPDIDWTTRWRVVRGVEDADAASEDMPAAVRLVETRAVAERLWPDIDAATLPRPDLSAVGRDWEDAFRKWRDAIALVLTLKGA
jgi:hypothetical protein